LIQEKRRTANRAVLKANKEKNLPPAKRGRPPKPDALRKRLAVRPLGIEATPPPDEMARILAEEDEKLRREAEEDGDETQSEEDE
jgi:hypothetical protein